MLKLFGPLQLLVFFFFCSAVSSAQEADYINVKKKNGRVLKTYFDGGFISAETFEGFRLHGYIRAIRNDSIILVQEQTRLVGTAFGTSLDTLRYLYGVDHRLIRRYFYKERFNYAGKKGFRTLSIPKLMVIGGTGFVLLELVNTLYREESINTNNKLPALAIATATAFSGWMWTKIARKRDQVGKKYVVEYMRAKTRE